MLKSIKFTLTLGAMVVAGQTAFAATECHESKWGKDDLIGSANLISPENTLKAAALIKRGKSQPLGIVIDSKTPAFAPRSLSLQVVQPNQQGGQKLDAFGYPGNYNDDILYTWVGIGSQIGTLAKVGYTTTVWMRKKSLRSPGLPSLACMTFRLWSVAV